MNKWVICIEGHGEGCDYTIGCNYKFLEYETESGLLPDLIDKLHCDFAGLNDMDIIPRIYMSGFEKYPEHVYDKVYVSHGELVDISDELRAKIKDMLIAKDQENEKQEENAEHELYKKLKEKYEKEV